MTAKSIMRLYDVTSGDVLHRMNEPMGGTGGGGWEEKLINSLFT